MIILEYKGNSYYSDYYLKTVTPKYYPDGTLYKNIYDFEKNEDIKDVNKIIWQYEDDKELFFLYSLCRHYEPKILEIPYIPNARQDRVKTDNDIYTLKYFAEIINSLNIPNIVTIDPHNYDICKVLFNNLYIVTPEKYINDAIYRFCNNKDLTLFFPDEGAYKRYSELKLNNYNHNLEMAFGVKKRNWNTGEIINLEIIGKEYIKDKNILIIDDICSKGGTAFHSALALKKLGAKEINLYVTHCEDTIEKGRLLAFDSPIKNIYTTDTFIKILNTGSDKLIVVDYANNHFKKGEYLW